MTMQIHKIKHKNKVGQHETYIEIAVSATEIGTKACSAKQVQHTQDVILLSGFTKPNICIHSR